MTISALTSSSSAAADLIDTIRQTMAERQTQPDDASTIAAAQAAVVPPLVPPPSSSGGAEAESLFEAMMAADTNGDGVVSADEFSALNASTYAADRIPADMTLTTLIEALQFGMTTEKDDQPVAASAAPATADDVAAKEEDQQSLRESLIKGMAMRAADESTPSDSALAQRFLSLLAEVV